MECCKAALLITVADDEHNDDVVMRAHLFEKFVVRRGSSFCELNSLNRFKTDNISAQSSIRR